MHSEAELKPETIERLEEQDRFLLRTYELELGKDPASRAAESARSNLIALRHTINQIYGTFSESEHKAKARTLPAPALCHFHVVDWSELSTLPTD